MNTIEALNRALFLDINGNAATPYWIVELGLVCAKYLAALIPLLLIGMWLTGRQRQRQIAVRACLVALLAFLVNFLIGLAWPQPRPFMLGLGHLLMPHAPNPSFPSDHATAFAAVAVTLLIDGLWRQGVLVALAGLAVAWARVFTGVHFPLDMLGAVVVGALVYALLAPFWRWRGGALTYALIVFYRQLFSLPIRLGWLRP